MRRLLCGSATPCAETSGPRQRVLSIPDPDTAIPPVHGVAHLPIGTATARFRTTCGRFSRAAAGLDAAAVLIAAPLFVAPVPAIVASVAGLVGTNLLPVSANADAGLVAVARPFVASVAALADPVTDLRAANLLAVLAGADASPVGALALNMTPFIIPIAGGRFAFRPRSALGDIRPTRFGRSIAMIVIPKTAGVCAIRLGGAQVEMSVIASFRGWSGMTGTVVPVSPHVLACRLGGTAGKIVASAGRHGRCTAAVIGLPRSSGGLATVSAGAAA